MYRRKGRSSWLKHWDFILIDVLCVEIAYLAACWLRYSTFRAVTQSYWTLGLLIEVFNIAVAFFTETHRGILRRGRLQEFKAVGYQMSLLTLSIMAYLFVIKESAGYSRSIILSFWVFSIVLNFGVRLLHKHFLIERLNRKKDLMQLLVVTTEEYAKESILSFTKQKYSDYMVQGVVLLDQDCKGEDCYGVPVVSNKDEILDYITASVVDEAFFNLPDNLEEEEQLAEKFIETGVTVHINLNRVRMDLPNKFVQKMNRFTVVTSSVQIATTRQMFIKRIMDICGGLVGLLITAVAFIIFAPIIFIQSPGPIFFSQVRVGRGGRKFKIHKFRSMYLDAEERKKELMEQNKMSGLMFKMDDDPRIIPIGKFMRKYSIDELPQFWDVVVGNMSLVGTRPPTVDEYEQYEQHHKVRLSIKPGITGMWQVSGRSDITDFEEVVRLDSQYISEWSLAMDIKILFRTIKVVLCKDGAV